MSILRIIAKILMIPVVVSLTIIQWIGIFLNSISEAILGILAFVFVLTGIASLLFGLVSGPGALKMIIVGFVFFMIPVIGEWVLTMIEALRNVMCNFIRPL